MSATGSPRERKALAGSALALAAACALGACGRTVHDPRQPALCRPDPDPPRVVRYLSAWGGGEPRPTFGLVLEDRDGVPTRVFNLADLGERLELPGFRREWDLEGPDLFRLADALWDAYRDVPGAGPPYGDAVWREYGEDVEPDAVCAPVPIGRGDLETGRKMVIGTAFNYRAHAEEAGGGEVFLFPKPVPATGPYRPVDPDPEVKLLDYEVELGFVLLDDLDLHALPPPAELEGRIAYFVANDVSDREPILRRQPVFGHSSGYAEAKGKPGFLPLGPWMVRGSDLQAFAGHCTLPLPLSLEVEEGGRRTLRQHSTTSLVRHPPREILEALGADLDARDHRSLWSRMTILRGERERAYPLARIVERDGRRRVVLPRGSVVLTGTPEGTAFHAPSRWRLVARAWLRLRSPIGQLLRELERDREREGYLAAGDVVVARIPGLGTQRFAVEPTAGPPPSDPCQAAAAGG